MKLPTTLLFFCLTMCLGATAVKAQNVNIPDANFKAYLVGNTTVNMNGDGEIQVSEATAFIGTINCSSLSIADLTGIEAFVNLTGLYCDTNQLSSLDVTQNTSLEYLYCDRNQLSSLDVSQNTSLAWLDCNNNQLSSLDVSQNTSLVWLYSYSNQLSSLDVKNGNNTNFTYFDATNNPNLSCIQVDDSTYSANNWSDIDATATFNTNCSLFSSTNSINQDIKLSAYPNPTTKAITLDFGKLYQEVTIQVTNLTGQVVLDRSIQNSFGTSLELEGAAAGVYFISIQTEEGSAILKIIKD